LHDNEALTGRSGDRCRIGIGAQAPRVGEAGTVVTDLTENPGARQYANSGKAGQDRRVGVLLEDPLGLDGESRTSTRS